MHVVIVATSSHISKRPPQGLASAVTPDHCGGRRATQYYHTKPSVHSDLERIQLACTRKRVRSWTGVARTVYQPRYALHFEPERNKKKMPPAEGAAAFPRPAARATRQHAPGKHVKNKRYLIGRYIRRCRIGNSRPGLPVHTGSPSKANGAGALSDEREPNGSERQAHAQLSHAFRGQAARASAPLRSMDRPPRSHRHAGLSTCCCCWPEGTRPCLSLAFDVIVRATI